MESYWSDAGRSGPPGVRSSAFRIALTVPRFKRRRLQAREARHVQPLRRAAVEKREDHAVPAGEVVEAVRQVRGQRNDDVEAAGEPAGGAGRPLRRRHRVASAREDQNRRARSHVVKIPGRQRGRGPETARRPLAVDSIPAEHRCGGGPLRLVRSDARRVLAAGDGKVEPVRIPVFAAPGRQRNREERREIAARRRVNHRRDAAARLGRVHLAADDFQEHVARDRDRRRRSASRPRRGYLRRGARERVAQRREVAREIRIGGGARRLRRAVLQE